MLVEPVAQPAGQQQVDTDRKISSLVNGSTAAVIAQPLTKAITNNQPTEAQRKTYIVENFNALPEEFRKCVLKAGITSTQADQNLEVILNILHFKTKSDFYTPEQLANKNKLRPRRYNCGESLIAPGIVSTATLEDEAGTFDFEKFEFFQNSNFYLFVGELLDTCHKRKDYKTIYQAGKGGFGRVFLAKSFKDKGSQVAVKRVPHVTTKQKRKNFQEIRFLKYCEEQQNIIRYHRAFLVKDEVWLVTEFMQGGTLTEVRC